MADKVPLEAVAEEFLLCREVLGAVLADEIYARLGERGELLSSVVLGGEEDTDLLPLAPAPLYCPLDVLAHAREPVPDLGPSNVHAHRVSLTTEARLRPVNGPCLRWE